MAAHLSLICEKFNSRSWMIRHLKRAGVPTADLMNVYASTIRPSIEYAGNVYHPMLGAGNSHDIKRLQMRILKIIFGYKVSYRQALADSGLSTLEDRHVQAFNKFSVKSSENPRILFFFRRRRPQSELGAQGKHSSP